jgi:hypothetical protein
MREIIRREARQEPLDPKEWERIRLIDKVEKLETKVKALERKMKDFENRGERRSLAVVGMLSLFVIRTIYRWENRGDKSARETDGSSPSKFPNATNPTAGPPSSSSRPVTAGASTSMPRVRAGGGTAC